jgi:hypothetical protein
VTPLQPAVLFLLGQPDAICGAAPEVKRGTLSLACSPNTDADRSKNSSVSPNAHEALCAMPDDWNDAGPAHERRAAIIFRPPFRCEVRRMKLGLYQRPRSRARLGIVTFRVASSFEKALACPARRGNSKVGRDRLTPGAAEVAQGNSFRPHDAHA